MKKWLFGKIFRKELKEKEELIAFILEDFSEQLRMMMLYEEELDRLENELKITNLILESLKLYGNR